MLLRVGLFMDGRRVAEEFKDEETRGALTADRAVAPFAMDPGGELEAVEDVLRRAGGVARPGRAGGAVVAMLV